MTLTIEAISYACAAVAFLLLGVFLAFSWKGNRQGGLLIAATFFSAVWGGVHAVQPTYSLFHPAIVVLVELFRNGLWGLLLVTLLPTGDGGFYRRVLLSFSALFVVLVGNATWGLFYPPTFGFGGSYVQILGQLLLSVFGVWLVEQVYHQVEPKHQWAIKYFCLALAGLFAYDFILYAEYVLFNKVNAELWVSRGFISIVIVPLIAISATRNTDWSVRIFVSRQVVFHTATLLSAGVYLLLMATAGYYLRYFGGSWGVVFQTTFFFAAVLFLLALLSSKTMRGKLMIYLSKHFFSYRYDYREEWLRIIQTLSDESSERSLYQRVVMAVSGIVDSEGGVLYLGYEGDDFQKVADEGLEASAPSVLKASPLMAFLQHKKWIVDLSEAPEKNAAPLAPDWLSSVSKAWLLVPLFFGANMIGFLVLKRSRSINHLHWEERDLLKTASYLAAGYLVQKASADALTEAKQFEGFNRASAFVVHDLKNLIAQLSLVVNNAKKHKSNPEFVDDAINTVDNSVQKMSNLMAHMRRDIQQTGFLRVDVNHLLSVVVEKRAVQTPTPVFQPYAEACYVRSPGDQFESVLGHLIQNAQDATEKQGNVKISIAVEALWVEIRIEDDGCGMSQAFIQQRLFKPFDTTKGLTGMGIGAYESKSLIESMGGGLVVSSEPDVGSTFVVRLPLSQEN